ncbi:MAG: hypothetical protein FWF88_05310 [Peptococcaceae bacterium]|nr:hypothetical protein [Peptococcaceae bacterium]
MGDKLMKTSWRPGYDMKEADKKELVKHFWRELTHNGLVNFLRMDLYRAFVSRVFPLAVLGMTFMLLISVNHQINELNIDVAYLHMVSQSSAFNDIFYVLAALPFAAAFCLDWNHQFLKPLLIRGSAVPYAVSKIVTCALSGFATVALGETLFILVLRLKVPLVYPKGPAFLSTVQFTHGTLLADGHSVLYFVIHIVGMSLGAAFYAVLALLVSTKFQNVFVVLASPMILAVTFRTLSDTLFVWLPTWATPTVVLIGRSVLENKSGVPLPVWSFLYETVVFWLVGIPLSLLIIRQLKRRMAYG